MELLAAGIEELGAGRGSLFLITGEPGIGKTRLADELCRLADGRGVATHWGRVWEAGGAPAYWPFLQLLRAIIERREAEALPRLVTDSEAPLGELTTPATSALERFQLFDRVNGFLRAAARDRARLLVLDDLHAADPSSLQLLHFLVRDLRSRPVMVVGTYREAEARLDPEISPLLAQIAREAMRIELRRLDREEVAEFATLTLGARPTDTRIGLLFQQTEGNPLFLRELLRLHGSTQPTDGIREIVRARLALLTPETRRVLEAAAVLGREFSVAPLAALAATSELEARARIEPAANAAIVESLDDPPRWRFTHALLRQGLYDDLPSARRTALHHAAATELARRPDGPPHAELAHHLVSAIPAVPAAEAARAVVAAAERAMELLAFEDARALYTTAERLVVDVPEEAQLRGEAVLGIGHAYMRAAEVELGKAACVRAAEIARTLDDSALFARAVLMSVYEFVPEVREQRLIAMLEEALDRLPPGDGALRARCMTQLAAARVGEPSSRPRIELARAGVAMARRLGDPEALRLALSGASIAMVIYAEVDESLAVLHELLRLALAVGDRRVALRAHMFLGGEHFRAGDLAGALPHQLALDTILDELHHDRFRWIQPTFRGLQATLAGELDRAAELLHEARVAAHGDQARGGMFAGVPVALTCLRERYTDLAAIEATTRATFGAMPHALGSCLGEMMLAQLHARAGDRTRAAAQLALVAADPVFHTVEEPAWLALLADACYVVGDRALAERIYTALMPRAEELAFLGPLTMTIGPPYTRQLGLLALALGRVDEAIAHLEHAVARATALDLRAHLARLWLELARALTTRELEGDRARAADRIARARLLAGELGQTALLALADELGQTALADELSATDANLAREPALAAAPAAAVSLHREGDVWLVRWGARAVHLRDSRGMQLLAQLVTSPDHELHVLQLVTGGDAPVDAGDAGAALDQRSIAAYRSRLLELREELDDAEARTDHGRIERSRTEIELLTEELSRAVGLGGRERRVGGAAERARTTAQKRIREAIRRIADELPELGAHLDHTVRTGLFCGYFPHRRR
jgi:hypothetical protein